MKILPIAQREREGALSGLRGYAVCFVSVVLGIAAGCSIRTHTTSRPGESSFQATIKATLGDGGLTDLANGRPVPWKGTGDWNKARSVSIQMVDGDGRGVGFLTSWEASCTETEPELRGIPVSGDVSSFEFSIKREAGTFAFAAQRSGREASGSLVFAADESFVAWWEDAGGEALTPDQCLRMALFFVGREERRIFARFSGDTGAESILRAKMAGVSNAWASRVQRALPGGTIDDSIGMSRAGVSAMYVERVAKARRDVEASDIIEMNRAGVSSHYVERLLAVDPDIATRQLVDLCHAGVSSGWFVAVRRVDSEITPEEMIALCRAGLSSSTYASYRAAIPDLSPGDAVRLCRSGVSSSFASSLRKVRPDFEPEDLIRLCHAGVSSAYVTALTNADCTFSSDDVVHLCNAGVSSAYVTALTNAGYTFSSDDIVYLCQSGVSSAFVAGAMVEGMEPLSAASLVEFYQMGVSSSSIAKVRMEGVERR